MQQRKLAIAIDGPAGTGKSTIARSLANQIGYVHVDTGAMYRAITLKALRTNTPMGDAEALIAVARACAIELLPAANSKSVVTLDGEDVSDAIRTTEIDRNVSAVARIGEIRTQMVLKQREMARKGGIIMDGRDIGTVVLPEADIKIFMVASPAIRAQRHASLDCVWHVLTLRRFLELEEKVGKGNMTMTEEQILADLLVRDDADSTREHGPLKKAEGAVEIDTSTKAPEEVMALILAELHRKTGQ